MMRPFAYYFLLAQSIDDRTFPAKPNSPITLGMHVVLKMTHDSRIFEPYVHRAISYASSLTSDVATQQRR